MQTISYRNAAIGCFAIGFMGAVGAFLATGSGGGIIAFFGAAIAGLGALFALLFYKYGYVLWPFVTSGARIVQVTDSGYEIPPSQDVILKNKNGLYYATMFLGVRIYESVTDKTPEENSIYSEYFERAISSVKFVTKFAMLVYVKDLTKYRESIETRHAEAQLRLSREREKPEPDVLKLDRYEREVAMWETQMNKMTQGVKPMGTICYVMTSAVGVSKEAATAAVKSQGNELRATISNALNVEVVPLTGEEMLLCFDWEHVIPSSQVETEQTLA